MNRLSDRQFVEECIGPDFSVEEFVEGYKTKHELMTAAKELRSTV